MTNRSLDEDSTVLRDIGELTSESLTARLRANGFLYAGQAREITIERHWTTRSSRLWNLRIEYSTEAPLSAPRRMLFKTSSPDRSNVNGREVEFYCRIAPRMLRPPVPRCFDAAYADGTKAYHLLLEDYSETHCLPEFPLPPVRSHAEMIVDTLARIHASWWDHPQLGTDIGEFPSDETIRNYVTRAANAFPGFADYMSDRLSPQNRRLYEQALADYPSWLQQRLRGGADFTLIHADAHVWNFLLPRRNPQGPVYVIDWYSHSSVWRCWTGPTDLATLIVPWWHPTRRAELEDALLRRYHEQLKKSGVRGYSWDDVTYDYRLAAISSLFNPLFEFGHSSPKRWLPQFEKATEAVVQLDCIRQFR